MQLAKQLRSTKRQRDKNRPRLWAQMAVHDAIEAGKIARQPCWVCGESAEAHHGSYAKDMRLIVTWLCPLHHRETHALLKECNGARP